MINAARTIAGSRSFAVVLLGAFGCGGGAAEGSGPSHATATPAATATVTGATEPAATPASALVATPETESAAPDESAEPPPRAFEVAAATPGTHWSLEERATAIMTGAAAIKRVQCTRCHSIDDLPSIGRPYDCVQCHLFLKALKPGERRYETIAARNGKEVLDRYIRNIEHLLRVPELSSIARRLRPEWIAGFLAKPYDLRPVLEESMIRNKLKPEEIEPIVRYFAAIADVPDPYADDYEPAPLPPKPSKAELEAGWEDFARLGCPSCHVFGNVDFKTFVTAELLTTMKAESLLAPNLRFVRERMRPDVLEDWIFDPKLVIPTAPMPIMKVTREEAKRIRDFLLFGSHGVLPKPVPATKRMRLPPPARKPVSWEELKERVLGKVCVHCHMNDHEKDTGPGNKGGLGFPGLGLSFRTYERTVWGSVTPEGKRYSVLEKLPREKLPRVLQVLLLRRVENRRDYLRAFEDRRMPGFRDGLLGMPLGLPANTDEEIGMLRRWLADDCPGPTGISGRPGFTDGFLVPDGPIAKNKGCELRAPADPPPEWSAAPRHP